MDLRKIQKLFNNYSYFVCADNRKIDANNNSVITCKEFSDFQSLKDYSESDYYNIRHIGNNPKIIRVCKYNHNKYATLQKKLEKDNKSSPINISLIK